MTTRTEWQQLAEDRILDAQAHLAPGVDRWSAAFYLVGYAVECGLKACVLARVAAQPEVIYQDKKFSTDAWTHDIERLLSVANIKADRDLDAITNLALYQNWQQVKNWSEQSRYLKKTQAEAQALFNAVTDPTDRVMQWIRSRW
ncbi:MAG: hypothetical protein SFU86_12405 [Pirellulaceae bacterium]|nr:hypothetical protein [Pirellulaceae bacterium]